MRKLILLATLALTAAVMPSAIASASPAPATVAAAPTAAQLLAKTTGCKQISNGKYKTDEDASGKTVAVCDANGAVFWKADMDIDCDGQRSSQCNENTDCCYQDDTAFHQSDGKPLNAAKLPYIVVPSSSSIWKYDRIMR